MENMDASRFYGVTIRRSRFQKHSHFLAAQQEQHNFFTHQNHSWYGSLNRWKLTQKPWIQGLLTSQSFLAKSVKYIFA